MKSPHLERTIALPAVIVALVCLLGGAGAAAAFESDTVGSFWGGLWWALCLMTTVGYVYGPPVSTAATIVSAVLVVVGFLLLSLLSATLAALFIRRDAAPAELLNEELEHEILTRLDEISRRVEAMEGRLSSVRRDREDDVDAGAAPLRVADRDRAAVRPDQPVDQVEPEA